jgi:hypothetical protein
MELGVWCGLRGSLWIWHGAGAQCGPKGGDPVGACIWHTAGSSMAQGMGIPVVCGSVQPKKSGSWQGMDLVRGWSPVWLEGWESWWCVDLVWGWGPAQPEGWRAQRSSAAALQAYGVGTWQASSSFIRLWHGENFHDLRVQIAVFLLSLVLFLSQVCLQSLSSAAVSGAHEVCGSVPVTILDCSGIFQI